MWLFVCFTQNDATTDPNTEAVQVSQKWVLCIFSSIIIPNNKQKLFSPALKGSCRRPEVIVLFSQAE